MKRVSIFAIFSALLILTLGCDKKRGSSSSSGYSPPTINYVCRVVQLSEYLNRETKARLYPSRAYSRSAAIEDAKEQYEEDYPDAVRVQAACFSCDIVKDKDGLRICSGG